jgi:predicted metal-dependent peptidase
MTEGEARRAMSECMAGLLTDKQFYGYLLQSMEIIHDAAIPAAMGVSYGKSEGRIQLRFNPKMMIQPLEEPTKEKPWTPETPVEPYTPQNLLATLQHECLHVVLRHLSRSVEDNRRLVNMAQDLVVNQQVQNVARGRTTLAGMKRMYGLNLPPNLHAEGYLELLKQGMPQCPIHGPHGQKKAPGGQKGGKPQKAPGQPGGQDPGQGQQPGQDGQPGGEGSGEPQDGQGEGQGDQPGQGNGSCNGDGDCGDHKHGDADGHGHGDEGDACPYCTGCCDDDHSRFIKGGDRDADEAMRSAIQYAYDRYKEEKERNPGNSGRGTLPSDVERMVEAALHRPFDWRRLIRSIGTSALKCGRRSTRFRPNRRYGFEQPGRKPTRAGKVIVVVDTSGSVGTDLLTAFWHEIRALMQKVEVCVIECDAGVHDARILRGHRYPGLKGGGGSDFTPAFNLISGQGTWSREWRGAVHGGTHIIFLTDGAIGVPKANPTDLPVYWALPEGASPPTGDYGTPIFLNVDGEGKGVQGRGAQPIAVAA